MKRSNLLTTAAVFAVLSFTAAQAEPEPGAMTPGGGAAGNIGAGGAGTMAPSTPGSSLDQPGNATGPSDSMGAKDKAAGSPPSAGDSAKDPKGTADAERDMSRDSKESMQKGDKGDSTAEGKSESSSGMSEDNKSGSTAERQGDAKAKDAKSARLESKDVSKVKTHFRDNKPNAKRIDRDEVSVSIGIALPGTIALYDLPPGVIVVTGPCPIQYFVWDDDIVLVDSCTREVVEIIADVA